jgi:hypothetical protein
MHVARSGLVIADVHRASPVVLTEAATMGINY